MIPRPAQYLLRFDDLCPTMSSSRWLRFQSLIEEFGIRPILAVVPDNRDPELEIAEPDPAFWAQMRAMEDAGAAIGLHGYRHLCQSEGRSLLPLHRSTEFSGAPEETQRQWIHAGLEILRGRGLSPRIWVAPRHGFDRGTLSALRTEGIGLLSDGFARLPFTRAGLTWIPQQLWAPVEKSMGLWTICVHPHTASDLLVRQLHEFLSRHSTQFTSVDRVLAELPAAGLSLSESFYAMGALMRLRARGRIQRLIKRG
jgi:predicted deacetylase